jgi:hypothetical protein
MRLEFVATGRSLCDDRAKCAFRRPYGIFHTKKIGGRLARGTCYGGAPATLIGTFEPANGKRADGERLAPFI